MTSAKQNYDRSYLEDSDRNVSGKPSPINAPISYSVSQTFKPDPRVLESNRVISEFMPGNVLQSYKLLRTRVVNKLQEKGWNSLGVLAARSGEGTSLTAVNLAISLSMDPRHTVLLVDFNLKNPRIHRFFGFQPERGVQDAVLGRASLSEVLFNPGIDSLLVAPAIECVDQSSELLASQVISDFVQDLKSRYQSRIIVFDLPPVLEADDAVVFSKNIDAGLVVICDGKSNENDLVKTAELMQSLPIIGTLYNNSFG